MIDFQVFYVADGCFLVTEQAVLCGQCGGAHYLFRNVGGKTLCLECAGSVVDTLAILKDSIERLESGLANVRNARSYTPPPSSKGAANVG